jgi:hypothetical protein
MENATLQVRDIAGARNERTPGPITCKALYVADTGVTGRPEDIIRHFNIGLLIEKGSRGFGPLRRL